jgi:hypothetical protein
LVLDAWAIVHPLDFIEGRILPVLLVAGTDLAVSASDDHVSILDRHLVDIVLVKIINQWFVHRQGVNSLIYGDVVFEAGCKDSADKHNLLLDLLLFDLILKSLYSPLFLYYEIYDGGLTNLLYLFFDDWNCLIEGKRDV